eukprot:scaffold2348_cov341-Prasinococcus_capsulatus_cf.AAC.1
MHRPSGSRLFDGGQPCRPDVCGELGGRKGYSHLPPSGSLNSCAVSLWASVAPAIAAKYVRCWLKMVVVRTLRTCASPMPLGISPSPVSSAVAHRPIHLRSARAGATRGSDGALRTAALPAGPRVPQPVPRGPNWIEAGDERGGRIRGGQQRTRCRPRPPVDDGGGEARGRRAPPRGARAPAMMPEKRGMRSNSPALPLAARAPLCAGARLPGRRNTRALARRRRSRAPRA